MTRLYHVTSTRNRESIDEHGLDWAWMGAAPGIAGSESPEVDGVFLCRDLHEVQWFMGFTATDQPVAVWAVDGIDDGRLLESPEGYAYLPARITRGALTRIDPPDPLPGTVHEGPSSTYQSTITLDDGTVLSDEQVAELRRSAQ